MIVSAEQVIGKDKLKELKAAGFVVVHDNLDFVSDERFNSAVIKDQWPEERGLREDYNSIIAISISIQNEEIKKVNG